MNATTGVWRLLAALGGVLIGIAVLDKKKPESSTPARPVVVNVHKRYVTRKPKARKRTKKQETETDSQNLEVAASSPVVTEDAGGAPTDDQQEPQTEGSAAEGTETTE